MKEKTDWKNIKGFEQALQWYKEMINQGIITPRGNQLLPDNRTQWINPL